MRLSGPRTWFLFSPELLAIELLIAVCALLLAREFVAALALAGLFIAECTVIAFDWRSGAVATVPGLVRWRLLRRQLVPWRDVEEIEVQERGRLRPRVTVVYSGGKRFEFADLNAAGPALESDELRSDLFELCLYWRAYGLSPPDEG